MAKKLWTVKSLVATLQQYPNDTQVGIDGCGCCAWGAGVTVHIEHTGARILVIHEAENGDVYS